jgi:hypothetical protein
MVLVSLASIPAPANRFGKLSLAWREAATFIIF